MERQGAASGSAAAAGAVTGNENYVPPPAEYAREREAARLRGAR
jgi:hypothetical protein